MYSFRVCFNLKVILYVAKTRFVLDLALLFVALVTSLVHHILTMHSSTYEAAVVL